MASTKHTTELARRQLLARRDELQRRAQRVGLDLARQHEPLSADFSDRAIQLENDEPLVEIGNVALRELEAIDEALDRIANGSYAVCKLCGDEISTDRLAAVPHAVTCNACDNG